MTLHPCFQPASLNSPPHSPTLEKEQMSVWVALPCSSLPLAVSRWCCIKRTNKTSSVVLVALKDVSVHEFQQHADCFPFLAQTFSQVGCLILSLSYSYGRGGGGGGGQTYFLLLADFCQYGGSRELIMVYMVFVMVDLSHIYTLLSVIN